MKLRFVIAGTLALTLALTLGASRPKAASMGCGDIMQQLLNDELDEGSLLQGIGSLTAQMNDPSYDPNSPAYNWMPATLSGFYGQLQDDYDYDGALWTTWDYMGCMM